MTNQEILNHIRTQFSEHIISFDEPFNMLTLEINSEILFPFVEFLKNDSKLQFNFMTDLCGIHIPNQTNKELGVVYMFHNWVNNLKIRIKCFVPLNKPQIASITSLFEAANWMERETFDFYGIKFKNHPNLKRILNEDTMDYHPLLKQYHLEDATRTDKDDRFFGRDGHEGVNFDKRLA